VTRRGDAPGVEALQQTARLLCGPLRRIVGLRRFLGLAGGVALPALVAVGSFSGDRGTVAAAALLTLAACLGGELLERLLFFTAVSKPGMSGGSCS
jgi:hypothetical protein